MSQVQKNLKARERLRMKELANTLAEFDEEDDDDDDGDVMEFGVTGSNLYDFLMDDDDDDDDDDESSHDDDNDEDMMMVNADGVKDNLELAKKTNKSGGAKKKRNNKKKKNKNKKKSLKQARKAKKKQKETTRRTSHGQVEKEQEVGVVAGNSLLCADRGHLDPDVEIKRKFGASVLRYARGDATYSRGSGRRRTLLVKCSDDWPVQGPRGLEMVKVVDGHDDSSSSGYRFDYTRHYQSIQREFEHVVATHQPQAVANFLQHYPYHCGALLQMSRIYMHHGENVPASVCLQRCLFTYESCFLPQFVPCFLQGGARLDYGHEANREFFLALLRYSQHLGKKGCCRTALEFTKLLLALDPSDPCCALIHFDYYALRSREFEYLLRVCDADDIGREDWPRGLRTMPTFAYSCALAKWYLESDGDRSNMNTEDVSLHMSISGASSSQLLQWAMLLFPEVVVPLLTKVGYSRLTSQPWHDHMHFRKGRDRMATRNFVSKLVTIMVERQHTVWKNDALISWINANANALVGAIDSDCISAREFDVLFCSIYDQPLPSKYRTLAPWDYSDATVPPLPEELMGRGPQLRQALPDEFTRINPTVDDNALLMFLRTLLPWVHLDDDEMAAFGFQNE